MEIKTKYKSISTFVILFKSRVVDSQKYCAPTQGDICPVKMKLNKQ